MSEENVELIQRFTEATDRGDLGGAVAIVNPTPEFEIDPPPDFPGPDLASGVKRGPEGLSWYLEQLG